MELAENEVAECMVDKEGESSDEETVTTPAYNLDADLEVDDDEIPEEDVSNDASYSAIAAEVQNGQCEDVVRVGLDGRLEPQENGTRQAASDLMADMKDDAEMLEKENFELREQNDMIRVKYAAVREQVLQSSEAMQVQEEEIASLYLEVRDWRRSSFQYKEESLNFSSKIYKLTEEAQRSAAVIGNLEEAQRVLRSSVNSYANRDTMLVKDMISATARINELTSERNELSQKLVWWLDSEHNEQRRYSSSMRNLEVSAEILHALRSLEVGAKASP